MNTLTEILVSAFAGFLGEVLFQATAYLWQRIKAKIAARTKK